MRYYFVAFLAVAILIAPSLLAVYPQQSAAFLAFMDRAGGELVAAVGLIHDPVTIAQLKTDYATATDPGPDGQPAKKVRILIVPGHEPGYGGAEGYGLKERQLNVELAQDLIKLLNQNGRFDVFTTRDDQSWTPEFADYFRSEWTQIGDWMRAHVAVQSAMQRVGQYAPSAGSVSHVTVPPDVAQRLYGINKWVDENGIDIAIHIHFNDYPGHPASGGKYNGFAIYVPVKQYYNSTTTKAVADAVFGRLARYNPVSNLPGEQDGVVEDHDLIAIGAFNSVDAASMLIEYAYLYEPRLQDPTVRHETLSEMAYETYLGLLDFFDPASAASVSHLYDTTVMPHHWSSLLDSTHGSSEDLFALQTALILDGDYPPAGKSMNECPRTGSFGPCTKAALAAFQAKYGITGEKDRAASSTLETLNKLYSTAL